MKWTSSKSLDKRYKDEDQNQIIAEIISINIATRKVEVNIGGATGPRNIVIADSLDIGTPSSPKVSQGCKAVLLRTQDEQIGAGYVMTDFIVGRANRMVTATKYQDIRTLPGQAIGTPEWVSIVLNGTDIVGDFTTAQGATQYEVWMNTSGSISSASLFLGDLTNTHFTKSFNVSPVSVVFEDSFEDATFARWITQFDRAFSITTACSMDGNYSVVGYPASPFLGETFLTGKSFPVSPGDTLTVSYSTKITQLGNGIGNEARVCSYWWDGGNPWNTPIETFSGSTSTWVSSVCSVTVPAGKSKFSLVLYVDSGAATASASVVKAYFDKIKVTNQSSISASTEFAVRAMDKNNGLTSPFSSWQRVYQQTKSIGSRTAAVTVTHQSYNYSASSGVQIADLGFATTGWDFPNETWSYNTASSFSVPGNVTARYFANVKIRKKQNGNFEYFNVSSASYDTSSSTTIVNVSSASTSGSFISASAITDNYYSYQQYPQGFPATSSGSSGGAGFSSGMVMWFNGASSSIPSGWTAPSAMRGRTIVGLPSSGTLAGTVGTALTNLQDVTHTHTSASHQHTAPTAFDGTYAYWTNAFGTESNTVAYSLMGTPTGNYTSAINYMKTKASGSANTGNNSDAAHLPYIQLIAIQYT